VKPGPDEHPLQYSYTFWFSRRNPGKASTQTYDQNLKKIGAFASVRKSTELFLVIIIIIMIITADDSDLQRS